MLQITLQIKGAEQISSFYQDISSYTRKPNDNDDEKADTSADLVCAKDIIFRHPLPFTYTLLLLLLPNSYNVGK